MAIEINLITPTVNERQVSISTPIVFDIVGLTDSTNAEPDLTTLAVQINGTYAIKGGVFQQSLAVFGTSTEAVGPVPLQTTRFYNVPRSLFQRGDTIEISDSINSVQTSVMSIAPVIDSDLVLIELKDTLDLLPFDQRDSSYQVTITTRSRGFAGSINITNSTVTINPLVTLPTNAVIFVIVEVDSVAPTTSIPDTAVIPLPPQHIRKIFTFRTSDSQPPQLVDFPTTIHNSNLAFKIVDVLNNQIAPTSIGISLNNQPAVEDGQVLDSFMGAITLYTGSSTADVYLRPKQKYTHNQRIQATIQVADGYGNAATYIRDILNHDVVPQVEFIETIPASDTTIDPVNSKFIINLRVAEPLNLNFINLFYEVDGVVNPETRLPRLPVIEAGRFVNSDSSIAAYGEHTGTIRTGSRDVSIVVDSLRAVTFNKKVKVFLVLQEVTAQGDIPVGVSPFYQKAFDFSSISAPLSPIVDNFLPTDTSPVPATTQIKCRIRSQVQGAPIALDSIRVTINNVQTAIDRGVFVGGWSGIIASAQGSQGHTANVTLNQPLNSSFAIGETVDVQVYASDIAGNAIASTFTFTVADTSVPIVTVTPPGGAFKKLTRIRIEADQPSTIYYTIDGSKPEIGSIATLVQTSPITNVPIFADGITQIKALAVSSSGVTGPITTVVFDLNPFVPEITILAPAQNQVLDKPSISIDYSILLRRGFLTLVQVSTNNGPLLDVQNTLPQSTVSITGLRPGANTVEILATDNAGNVGRAKLLVNVKASQILNFGLKFAPLQCPVFTPRQLTIPDSEQVLADTVTVALIGLGSRREVLVSFGIGNGEDGAPVNFSASQRPDGRHFLIKSFPIRSHKLYLYRKGRTIELSSSEYVLNASSGQLVLDHPIETGENLVIEYTAEPDINSPTMFTSFQREQLYAKHGYPSTQNTLSLAAQIAFENGALRVLVVQAEDPSVDSTWFHSFAALEREEAYWIVPVVRNNHLSSYPTLLQAAYMHAEEMSNIYNRKERVVAGWRTPNANNDFNQPRVFLTSLDQNPRVSRIINGESQELNGTFVAVAVAALNSGLTPTSTPITGRTIQGFTLHTTRRSPKLDLQKEIDGGFMPIQALSSGASIYRGRTAYTGITDPVREELSIQRVVDDISKELRRLADNRFRGRLLNLATIKSIGAEIQTFLDSKTALISKGRLVNLQVDNLEPRQINIEITLVPLYPLNEFSITFTLSAGI